jgi:dipeptidyl aminopeptidase/acylaminoacyl peptidase
VDDPATPRSDVVVVDTDSGRETVVATDASSGPLAWPPQTSTLAYETGPNALALLDVSTGERQAVTTSSSPETLRWTRDGALLAVGEEGAVDVVDATGERIAHADIVSDGPGPEPQWADDTRLSYVEPGVGLVALDVHSGHTTTLVPETEDAQIQNFAWSPDGSEVAVQRERFPGIGSDVVVLDSDGNELSATSGYPDGGDNQLWGWVAGPTPSMRTSPSGVRTVMPRALARSPGSLPAATTSSSTPPPRRLKSPG